MISQTIYIYISIHRSRNTYAHQWHDRYIEKAKFGIISFNGVI